MVDIHHHLLPGLDDGSNSLDTSVAMARLAAEDGITHIVCTPHANGRYSFDPAANSTRLAELRRRLDEEQIGITLGTGCDFHLSYENVSEARLDPSRFTINGFSYLLVEPPDYGIPQGLEEIFYQLQLAGITPILTHPERNPTFQAEPDRLKPWLRAGVLIQVTADSLTGHKGRKAQQFAHQLLALRWAHFLATDAHNTTSRPPRLREAHDLVAGRYGASYAHALCVTNPLAAFLGKEFVVEEEPHDLYDEPEPSGMWQALKKRLSRR